MQKTTAKPTAIPESFQLAFRQLVVALQPRGLDKDAVSRYWAVVAHLPKPAILSALATLKQQRFWPNTGDLYHAVLERCTVEEMVDASHIVEPPVLYTPVVEGSRTLDELDALAPNDPERDEICKRLSLKDQQRLMARYGLKWGVGSASGGDV